MLPVPLKAALSILALLAGSAAAQSPASQAVIKGQRAMQSTIAFSSTRDDPATVPPFVTTGEIYLMNDDASDVRRLTTNQVSDVFPSLSPDGTKIIFESNRRRGRDDALNVSDLFLMNTDGGSQTWLWRGSSATWSPDGTRIVFQASASGRGLPANPYPGAATVDSDLFMVSLRDLLDKTGVPRNITNNPSAVDDDADWSPDGRTLIFTSHATTDNHTNAVGAEIYAMSADGTGVPIALTKNTHEERAPSWSPDGTRIVYCCRRGTKPDFDICVMNADGSGERKLTDSPIGDLTPSWSPDGTKIVFHRGKGQGLGAWDLWVVNADGTGEARLTDAPGYNGFASWGEVARPQGKPGGDRY